MVPHPPPVPVPIDIGTPPPSLLPNLGFSLLHLLMQIMIIMAALLILGTVVAVLFMAFHMSRAMWGFHRGGGEEEGGNFGRDWRGRRWEEERRVYRTVPVEILFGSAPPPRYEEVGEGPPGYGDEGYEGPPSYEEAMGMGT